MDEDSITTIIPHGLMQLGGNASNLSINSAYASELETLNPTVVGSLHLRRQTFSYHLFLRLNFSHPKMASRAWATLFSPGLLRLRIKFRLQRRGSLVSQTPLNCHWPPPARVSTRLESYNSLLNKYATTSMRINRCSVPRSFGVAPLLKGSGSRPIDSLFSSFVGRAESASGCALSVDRLLEVIYLWGRGELQRMMW